MVKFHVGSCEKCQIGPSSTSKADTYISRPNIGFTGVHHAAIEAAILVAIEVFIGNTRITIVGADDGMVTRPEDELDDVARQSVDAVWCEEMCSVADFDRVYSNLVLCRGRCRVVDGACRTVDFLCSRETRERRQTRDREPSSSHDVHVAVCQSIR